MAVNTEFLREGTAIEEFRNAEDARSHNYLSERSPKKSLYTKVEGGW